MIISFIVNVFLLDLEWLAYQKYVGSERLFIRLFSLGI